MGAIATLQTEPITVAPGDEVVARLTVRNAGTVVDEFTFEIVGATADWAVVMPDVVRLLPDGEEIVDVVFRPPLETSVAAGTVPFGVKVISKEDSAGTVVEEGTLTLGARADLAAELIPRTSRGRRSAVHDLAVDNRGNRLVNAEVVAYDEDELLDLEVEDPGLVAEPGTAVFTRVKVKPRKRFLRGPNRTIPFKVLLEEPGVATVGVDGTMLQQALIPAWTVKALMALIGLLAFLALLYVLAVKPAIDDAEEAAVQAGAAAQDAQTTADTALDAANNALEILEEPTVGPGDLENLGVIDFRASATDAVGGGATKSGVFPVPEERRLELTDVILQNPAGNRGLIRVLRNDEVILEAALENFRDLDYHFVTPILLEAGAMLGIEVVCTGTTTADGTIDPASGSCTAAAQFVGRLARA